MSAVASVRAVQARIASIESRFGAPAPWSRTDFTVKAQPVATQPVATEPVTGRTMPAPTAAAPVFPDVMARAVTSADAPYGASRADDGESVPAETPFAAEFVAAGRRHGISPTILAAVGYVESAYQPHVVSPAGAIGLMQLMPATAASLGVDPTDPASAIDGAARLLRSLQDRFGSIELALGAYNVGPGTIARSGGILPGSQAERYVSKVLSTERGMR